MFKPGEGVYHRANAMAKSIADKLEITGNDRTVLVVELALAIGDILKHPQCPVCGTDIMNCEGGHSWSLL
jgi:hypothetical protein